MLHHLSSAAAKIIHLLLWGQLLKLVAVYIRYYFLRRLLFRIWKVGVIDYSESSRTLVLWFISAKYQ